MWREIGYRSIDAWIAAVERNGLVVAARTINGGTVVAVRRGDVYYVAYRCDDARAWGSLLRTDSEALARAEFARIIAGLEEVPA